MKKFLAVLLVLVLAFTFAACSGSGDNGATEAPSDTEGGGSVDYSKVKVGVIHIGDPADGTGYSFAHDEGIKGMQEALNLSDDQIVRKLNVADDNNQLIKESIEDCIVQGCTIIFGTSYGYMDIMEELANEYPEVIFSHGTGNKSNDTNFNNYFGRIYQARYLAGIAAGLKTETNKIGYVSAYGTEMAETCSGINAFALGVQAVNPEAVVYVKTLNSWFDPTGEKENAEALLAMDCDVIAQHCDTANPQNAAEEHGKFGCGYNSDMTKDAPKAHLTAPIWNWSVYYTAAVTAAAKGEWAQFGNYYAGIKEGFVDISPLSDNCAENTQEYIDAVKALFNEGSWDVFSNVKLSFDENGNIVKTESALKDNRGNEVITADNSTYSIYDGDNLVAVEGGASAIDGIIKESMNYFVEGVELR